MGIRKEGLERKSRNYQEGHDDNTRVTTSGTVCPLVRNKTQTDEMEKPF
jgi:hypothetical protein